MRRLLTFVFTFALAAIAVRAESVRWEPGDSGDASDLQLVFEDCSPDGDPQLPRIPGLTLALTGSSSQTTMNNFTVSRSTILLYRARSQGSAAIKIPSFTVKTNKGELTVPAFTGGTPKTAADANVLSRLEPGAPSVWAGEVFPISYVLDVSRRSFNQLGTNIEWDPSPLVVEEWSKFEPSEVNVGGEARLHISSKARAYAKTPGTITLNPANQLVNLQSGSIGFGLFQTPRIEQLSVTSNTPPLVVRPLPSPSPVGFSGAVGQFKLTSKVIPTNAAVGEPVTWTIELTGTGNWPDIAGLPQREVSKDFNVVQPQAKRTPTDGKLFDATLTEDVVLVPTRSGEYTLGPVDFVYFDPKSQSYKTVSAPRTTISISAPAAATSPAAPGKTTPTLETAPTPSTELPSPELKTPALPQGIPRDSLPGSSTSMTPLRRANLVALIVSPFGLLIRVWGYLAVDRARRTDPLVPQRAAKTRLAATIAELKTAKPAEHPALLLRWQHDSALLWKLRLAAPAATALPDAAWSTLWSEAERALYSPSAALPADWTQRADAALTSKRVPGFQALTAFFPRNLFPFVASIAFLLLITPVLLAQETKSDAAAAYIKGDFVEAEKAWRDALAKKPADSIARHNLSLALAQQDRWGEAQGHATAAFVQRPSAPQSAWQLRLTAEKAGFLPTALAAFFPSGPRQSLAAFTSPAGWQVMAIAAACLVSIGLGLALHNAYRRRSSTLNWVAGISVTLALLVGVVSASSLAAYGDTGDSNSVIVWRTTTLRSIPTEADTTQKTTPLAAGSVGVMRKTLFGWVQLAFENDQTGWVRKEDVIPLWAGELKPEPAKAKRSPE